MNILITGICGFVGSNLARALQQRLENRDFGVDNFSRAGSETNRMRLTRAGSGCSMATCGWRAILKTCRCGLGHRRGRQSQCPGRRGRKIHQSPAGGAQSLERRELLWNTAGGAARDSFC